MSGYNRRTFELLCDCGETVVASLTGAIEGKTQSCGCLNKDLTKKRATRHGDEGSRLNSCWKDMRRRAKDKYCCEVHPEWMDYIKFKSWALDNGYNDSLVLSRYRDEGGYFPDNCEWVSKTHNTVEAHSYYWLIKTPTDCSPKIVYNLTNYCRINKYNLAVLSNIASGKVTVTERSQYFGWEVEKIMKGTENINLWDEELSEY